LLYHTLLLLQVKNLSLGEVVAELELRHETARKSSKPE
jgi:phosphoribosyl-ATP pyrophosphohydrolase